MSESESVIIVGAGAVGVNAALFLGKLGFRVELIDSADDILQGAPLTSFINHGDGLEYHKRGHYRTGEYCIDGSLVKGLIYPLSAFRTDICDEKNPVRFIVAAASIGKNALTLESFRRNADHMGRYFGRQLRTIKESQGWTDDEAREHFLRSPGGFSRWLTPSDLTDLAEVAGGCTGSSFGINMPHYYAFLKAALREVSVSFRPSSRIETIENVGGKYIVHAGGSKLTASHVLVTAGHQLPKLAAKVYRAAAQPLLSGTFYLNSMTFLRLPATHDQSIREGVRRIDFILQQEHGSMFACVVAPTETEDGLAVTYFPSEKGSQRHRHYFDRLNPKPVPEAWEGLIAKDLPPDDQNVAATFRQLGLFSPSLLGYAEIVHTLCRPVFNAGSSRNLRGSDRRVREISGSPIMSTTDGRVTMWAAPKWTNAELVALIAADHVLTLSRGSGLPKSGRTHFGPTRLDVAEISKTISFQNTRMKVADALHYAAQQGVPSRVVKSQLPHFAE